MTFVHTHRVRYHETDAQSYLFNSRYLEIADVAMTEFFRHLGWTYRDLGATGVDPSVVNIQLSFKAPAHFDDLLAFHVTCARVGRTSFELGHSVLRDGTQLAELHVVYVNVDAAQAAARPIPAAIADALTRHRSST
jgi:acyl-CoA thioester hydrolase